jgi:transmembrane sensor
MNNTQLLELFQRYYKGATSEAETNELAALLKDISDEELSDILLKTWNVQDKNQDFFKSDLKEKLLSKIHSQETEDAKIVKMGTRKGTWIVRISVAAAILSLIAFGGVFFLKAGNHNIAQAPANKPLVNDIPPGGEKAILTLADGRKVVLDTASNGSLAVQGGIQVIKLGGQLSYNQQTKSTGVLYNTITTPRGGQYQLELADGSKVWLNAASSLRFPTAFVGGDRTVELTGEGYFEVSHDPAKPFHVKVNDLDVMDLGTHFNISSYTDESTVRTTLLEGRVEVRNAVNHVYLNPGQQAKVNDVNVDEVMAWKNGYFSFNNADIKTVMRQLSRWYDIDVVYEGDNDETFSGKIDRKLSLKDLLDGLGQTKVHYRIDGNRKLVILP